jgi:Uma2 family endonuclease
MKTVSRRKSTAMAPTNGLPRDWSLADLRRHLGGVPLDRIRLFPTPGTATENDALRLHDREDRLYELVDGILVEKTVGVYESILTCFLIHELSKYLEYLERRDVGFLLAPDGPFRLFAGRMRMPDISLVLWERFPDRVIPEGAVFPFGPDLAIEVISKGNTKAEMRQKLREYFRAGAKLVWYIYPQQRRVLVYTSLKEARELNEDDVLEGDSVLPAFRLKLRALFDRIRRGA